MTLMSRTPTMAMCSVRGIGVAVRVSTSTSFLSSLSRSFWATPKRCSSSTTTRPRFLNWISCDRRRWVPITTSTLPSLRPAAIRRCSISDWNLDITATFIGKPLNRSTKVL
ncbi:MAG: hypothetical protein BWY85_02382 [Firmicutes bacterium ADurb.Bin506]|nr:MAG: hypothetical protein BWY85_02382 [Firmicutes bacterium ADurb.Bin506]